MSSQKATRKGGIPTKILKDSINASLSQLSQLSQVFFSDDLKLADIADKTHALTKKDSLNKESYWPVSIMPHLSKVFEGNIYQQIDRFMEETFSFYLCGFRKNYNAQYWHIK